MDIIAALGLDVDSRPINRADTALDRFQRSAGRAERSAVGFERAGRGMALSAARVTGAVAGMVASIAGIGAAINVVASFERSMSQVQAVTRATGQEFEAMRQVAMDLGATTQFTAAQAADGLRFLGMAGFSAAEGVAAIPDVLSLAAASGMELAQTADIASNIMSGFAIAATDMADVSDVLAAASSRANTNVAQLGQGMSYVAPVSAAMGVSLRDTAAAIGVMSDAGIQGMRAGTGLRAIMARLASPTDAAQEALASLGLTAAQISPETNSLTDIMAELGDAGIDTSRAMELVGMEAAPALLALTSQAPSLASLTAELSNVAGEAQRMAEVMNDNLRGDFLAMTSAASGLALALGDAGLTSALRSIVQGATNALRGLTAFVGYVSEAAEVWVPALTVALVGLAATTIPAMIGALATMASGLTAAAVAAGVLTTATGVLGAALALVGGPIGLLVGLLAAGAAYVIAFGDNTEQASAQVQAAHGAQDALNAAMGTFSSTAAPEASANAVALANDYVALSQAAYSAAEATLAMRSAEIERARSVYEEQGLASDPEAAFLYGAQQDEAQRAYTRALRDMREAEIMLADSRQRQQFIAGQITGATVDLNTALGQGNEELGVAVELTTDLETAFGGGDSGGGLAEALENAATRSEAFNDAMADAAMTAEEFGRSQANIMVRGVDSIANAFGDFVARGFRDFSDFAQSVVDTFRQMLAQMIAMAVRNRIMIGLGFSGGGMAAAGQAVAGGLGGGGGLLGGLFGGGGGGGGFLGSFGSSGGILGMGGLGGGTGLMGGLGNAISGGLGNIFSIGANAAAAGGGIAASIGAALPVIGIAAAAFSLLRTRTKEVNNGLQITVDEMGVLAEQFKIIKKVRAFGGRSYRTYYSDAEAETQSFVETTVRQLQDGVVASAEALGFAAEMFDGFATTFKVSFYGKDEEEAQAALEAALTGMSDEMALLVPGLQEFIRAGDGAYDTLSRLATSLTSVNFWMGNLGLTVQEISLAGGAAASNFVDLFGSIDAFNSAAQSYYQNFYSDSERLRRATELLSIEFAALGAGVMPTTRHQFRDLVDAADAAGDTELVAALIQLAPAFADITQEVNALDQALNGQSLFRTLADQVYADTSDGYRKSISQVLDEAGDETAQLLREVVTAIREGDLNNARIQSRLLAIQQRAELDPVA